MVLTPDSRAPPARSTHEQPAPQQATWWAPSPVSQENKHHAKRIKPQYEQENAIRVLQSSGELLSSYPSLPGPKSYVRTCQSPRVSVARLHGHWGIRKHSIIRRYKINYTKRTIPIEYWRPLQSELTNRTTGALNLLFQSHFYLIFSWFKVVLNEFLPVDSSTPLSPISCTLWRLLQLQACNRFK